MNDQKHLWEELTECIGSALHYCENEHKVDLTRCTAQDINNLYEGWKERYQGNWKEPNFKIEYPLFKNRVDMITSRLMQIMDKEIHRRFAVQWNEYMADMDKKG